MNRLNALARGAAIALALALGACASGARSDRMAAPMSAAEGFAADHPYRNALAIDRVQGGSETNPLLASSIADADFREALTQSLRNAGLLAADASAAQYEVIASLQDIQQPFVGLDMSVTLSVRYSVVPAAGGDPVFDEVVAATGTATMSEAFMGVERLQMANEAAARNNIAEFLRRLQSRVPATSLAPTS